MNTDDVNIQEEVVSEPQLDEEWNQGMNQIVEVLSSVDTNSPEANPNRTLISDNNGGSIELNQENIIKK